MLWQAGLLMLIPLIEAKICEALIALCTTSCANLHLARMEEACFCWYHDVMEINYHHEGLA